jgi:itaconate CoA-transferase
MLKLFGAVPVLKPISGDGWTPRIDAVPVLGADTDAILQ